ncbi:MAG: penicillin-binding protein 2 [Campylobacteraceae bacterium]|jgi:cell division protein FtsI (penicillin-binding protein 3)|nr:penicillin-binding protein 2 [Campylobacteraceae bacterium]
MKDEVKSKFLTFFIFITIGFIVFIATLLYWSSIDLRSPNLQTSDAKMSLRGSILSADNYMLANSQRLYKVVVDTRNIDPEKKELFIKLYCLYTNDSEARVRKIINSEEGSVTISYSIDSKSAEHLQSLAGKLLKLGVFKSYTKPNGIVFLHGMDIIQSGELRVYPYKDTLSPIVGYVRKIEQDAITRREGVKGIERFYEDKLSFAQDSYIVGYRDAIDTIILNKEVRVKESISGQDIQLSVPLKLQKIIERKLDLHKVRLDAKEIIAVVMKSDTGDILSLASSNRYDANSLKQNDYPFLNIQSVEYIYEPGSVIKPIVYALLLKNGKITPKDIFRTHGGEYNMGKYNIKDEHKFQSEWITARDAIVYSSNVVMAQLGQKLDAAHYYEGLTAFGFGEKSGIDLAQENTGGKISANQFKSEITRAANAYGYGINVNFIQLIKAFNVFNNNGLMIKPKIVSSIIDRKNIIHEIKNEEPVRVIPEHIANTIQKTLIDTVKEGSGTRAFVEGITVGGKTGTAQIAQGGVYYKRYNSSFIGFANDNMGNKYTIGVLVIEPNRDYFGAQSAAPIFKDIALGMIEEGRLYSDLTQ